MNPSAKMRKLLLAMVMLTGMGGFAGVTADTECPETLADDTQLSQQGDPGQRAVAGRHQKIIVKTPA